MAFAQFATLYPGPDAEESLPIVPICAVVLLSQTAIFIELALTPSWVQQYTDEPYALAAISSAGSWSLFLGTGVLGRATYWIGVRRTLQLSLLFMALSCIFLSFQQSYTALFIIRTAMFFFIGTQTLCKTYVSISTPEPKLAGAMSSVSASQMISISIGAAIALFCEGHLATYQTTCGMAKDTSE